MKKNPTDKQH